METAAGFAVPSMKQGTGTAACKKRLTLKILSTEAEDESLFGYILVHTPLSSTEIVFSTRPQLVLSIKNNTENFLVNVVFLVLRSSVLRMWKRFL